MKVKESNSDYWNNRYLEENTAWDIGYANPVLIDYVKRNFDKNTKILIPGAGTAHEVAELFKEGYKKCYAVDFSQKAKDNFLKLNPGIPADNYFAADFFALSDTYDAVIEQTFFCAIHPSLRKAYVKKMHDLLNSKGILAGLLFEMEKEDGPPYGGTKAEYIDLFSSKFEIKRLESTSESISSRLGRELFFEFVKK